MSDPLKVLLAFVNEADTWHDVPVYKAIVQRLQQLELAGATAHVGIMGFGHHHRIHRKGLFGIMDDRPVTIVAVDRETRIRAAASEVRPMIRDGLMLIVDAEQVGEPLND